MDVFLFFYIDWQVNTQRNYYYFKGRVQLSLSLFEKFILNMISYLINVFLFSLLG